MTQITLEFLQDLLKEDFPDVEIQEFQGAPGTNRGDNYTSMVYRVTLKGVQKVTDKDGSDTHEEPWETTIIYKVLPESILRREAFKSDELFCNEVAFYNKIWPTMQEFQTQWDRAKNPFKAVPKCYLAQNDLVILKDLKPLGFQMPDRRKGLSTEQCYFVLKHLAQFHALSLAMKCNNPDDFYELLNIQDGISEVFFVAENAEYYRTYYHEAIRNAIDMLEEELGESADKELYLGKFKSFCDERTFFQTMVDLVAPQEPLAVVCHGDFWTNNMLFRYKDGDIAEFFNLDGKRFCFTFIADIPHDDFNVIATADDDVTDFLRDFKAQGRLEDTLLMFMGDHGPRYSNVRNTYQGKLEERLPLMAIVLPEKLKNSRPEALDALKHNVEVLTTPHDIHATILDALDMRQYYNPYKIPGADLKRGLSLLEPVPRNRSCSEAGIEPHWCACLKWTSVAPSDPLYSRAAEALVDKINSITEFMRYSNVRNTYQGKLEERLPLMAIVLPEKLKNSRPEALDALKHNVEVLTTPHDIHATILDALDMRQYYNPYKIPGADLKRGLSLLEPVPRNRSCSEAGIEPHWCACLKWTSVAPSDPLYSRAAEALVDKINSITEFMRYSNVRNTYQGKLEERLPLMAIVLPEKLKNSRPEALDALKHNVEVLTTPHDIHATILDALDMRQYYNPYKIPGADLKRGLSLLEPVPRNRSCSEAGIEPHWCACLKWTSVAPSDPLYSRAAEALVDKINSITEFMRSKCAIRTLASVQWVMRTTPRKAVVEFDGAKDHDGYVGKFSAKNMDIPKENFQVKITVGPGEGVYEASLVYTKQLDKFTVSLNEISRVSAYGNEPSCISEQHPRLNMFCYCKS